MKRALLGLLLVSNTALSCPSPSMTEAAIFDTTTTIVGLSMYSTAVELNPLGVVGATIGRLIILANEDKIDVNARATASAIWMGAGVHNIVHTFGLAFAPSIIVGIIAGLVIKQNNDCSKGN